jgi:hypothetical protein
MATAQTSDSFKKLESSAVDSMESLKATLEQGRQTAEDKIREYPLAAVAGAAALGFVFRFGVFRGLMGLIFRLAIFSVKPALLVAALMKVVELMKDAAPAASPEAPTKKKAVKSTHPLDLVDAPEIENPVLR